MFCLPSIAIGIFWIGLIHLHRRLSSTCVQPLEHSLGLQPWLPPIRPGYPLDSRVFVIPWLARDSWEIRLGTVSFL